MKLCILTSSPESSDPDEVECRTISDHICSVLRRIRAISPAAEPTPHPADRLGHREVYRAGDLRIAVVELKRLAALIIH